MYNIVMEYKNLIENFDVYRLDEERNDCRVVYNIISKNDAIKQYMCCN